MVALLDQFPNARTVAISSPAFCTNDADVDLTSFAVEEGEDLCIISLIQPAIVSTDAGVYGFLVIRNKAFCFEASSRH